MLVLGTIAFMAAIFSISYSPNSILVAPFVIVLFIAYEANRFKYWKIYCEFALTVVLTAVTLLVFT